MDRLVETVVVQRKTLPGHLKSRTYGPTATDLASLSENVASSRAKCRRSTGGTGQVCKMSCDCCACPESKRETLTSMLLHRERTTFCVQVRRSVSDLPPTNNSEARSVDSPSP